MGSPSWLGFESSLSIASCRSVFFSPPSPSVRCLVGLDEGGAADEEEDVVVGLGGSEEEVSALREMGSPS